MSSTDSRGPNEANLEDDRTNPDSEKEPNNKQDESNKPQLWTDTLPVTEGTTFFKSVDWSATTLGLPETWSPTLRFAVNLLFVDSRGACIYWGDEWVAIYNEIYKPMAGQAHPKLMGKPFIVGYPELWENIRPIFDHVKATGTTMGVENIELFTDRFGYNEETYFIGQFIPLRGSDGLVEGVYNTVYESTLQVLQSRRQEMINQIAAIPEFDRHETNRLIEQVLKTNVRDVPMAMLYSLEENIDQGTQLLQLQLNMGVKNPSQWIPTDADINLSSAGIVSQFRIAFERKAMLILRIEDTTLPESIKQLMKDIDWLGFGEPSKVLIIAPLISVGNVQGFLVLGSNPRRNFDQFSEQFAVDIASQIAGKWASALTVEQSRAREERLIRNLEERERRIRYMAQSAPVGMLHLKTDGSIAWANQHYYDMTAFPTTEQLDLPFLGCFHEDDQALIRTLWHDLLENGSSATCQARLKQNYHPPSSQDWRRSSEEHSAWVLAQGFPLKDDEVELIMICFTDISGLKWAESVQSRAKAAAEKSKRQQEEFIDITSHEMRNPLSAIIQSAEAISASLKSLQNVPNQDEHLGNIEDAIDAAETILSCGVYQKRIIDDVLMLSRLDNDMLSITPVIVNPVDLIRSTLKMLDGNRKSDDIRANIIKNESLEQLGIINILCDPLRVAQILTNLFSNAFKFTRNEKTRLVEITCGASLRVPIEQSILESLQWSSTGKSHTDLTLRPEWGDGETVYIYFMVRDSGSGMTQQELDRLFIRFSQANSNTYIKHGGSGLGLYISRELAEKHGGHIGVNSTPNQGSTFAFYIKTRRTEQSTNQSSLPPDVASPPVITLSDTLNHSLKIDQQYNILLVEDNLINQRVLARQLKKAKYVVHIANDGLEALEFIRKTNRWTEINDKSSPSIDVILMDWNMPVLDGVSCTRQIRSLEVEGKIRGPMVIIGITANARIEQLNEAKNAGMNEVLSKPFLLDDLLTKITSLVKD